MGEVQGLKPLQVTIDVFAGIASHPANVSVWLRKPYE